MMYLYPTVRIHLHALDQGTIGTQHVFSVVYTYAFWGYTDRPNVHRRGVDGIVMLCACPREESINAPSRFLHETI